ADSPDLRSFVSSLLDWLGIPVARFRPVRDGPHIRAVRHRDSGIAIHRIAPVEAPRRGLALAGWGPCTRSPRLEMPSILDRRPDPRGPDDDPRSVVRAAHPFGRQRSRDRSPLRRPRRRMTLREPGL